LQIINCLSWSLIIYAVGHALGLAGLAILHRFGIAGLIVAVLLLLALAGGLYWRYGHDHVKNALRDRSSEPLETPKKKD